jgi:DNA-binding CsgD family transcriptional regulator
VENSLADVMGVVGRVAAVAADQDSAQVRAEYVLDELEALIPFAAADFSAIDPVSGDYVQLARRGYSDQIIAGLRDSRFVETLDLLGLQTTGQPTRMRDVPGDPLDTWVIGEILVPAGYQEGLTMCLKTHDGRLTGAINLSTESVEHPSDVAREAIGFLCNTLGSVADLTQSNRWFEGLVGEGKLAVGIDAAGTVIAFSGSPKAEFFNPDSELLAAAKKVVDRRIGGSFIWPADSLGEDWFRINVIIISARETNLVAVITMDTADEKHLSQRELEVLTMAAQGLSNREIATGLFISDRTVQTHVEHILLKLAAPNRAAAAAIGAQRGLLLGKVRYAR